MVSDSTSQKGFIKSFYGLDVPNVNNCAAEQDIFSEGDFTALKAQLGTSGNLPAVHLRDRFESDIDLFISVAARKIPNVKLFL